MENVYEQAVREFTQAVRRLWQSDTGILPRGRAAFAALPPGDRVGYFLRTRAALRVAIGTHVMPQHLPKCFGADLQQPVVVFLADDLLQRFPAALAKLQPRPVPTTALDPLRLMLLLHPVMDLAAEEQDVTYLPPGDNPARNALN